MKVDSRNIDSLEKVKKKKEEVNSLVTLSVRFFQIKMYHPDLSLLAQGERELHFEKKPMIKL